MMTDPIWNPPATIRECSSRILHIKNSQRAGGDYEIAPDARDIATLDDTQKALLTTWLVDQRLQGIQCPRITNDIVKHAIAKKPLSVRKRAERLLQFMANQASRLGEELDSDQNAFRNGAYAWSESVRWDEVSSCLEYLDKKGWIQNYYRLLTVTVEGYKQLEAQAVNIIYEQVFVAMWFNATMNDVYENGLRLGIKCAGYEPMRIDKKSDINKIDDEILAEIRRSRFLVADFTQGGDGASGGVYFEAGFALGLDIPVIFTCRHDMESKLHFDTRQYAHILWNTPKDLRKNLRNRIIDRIGEGPRLTNANS